MTLKDMYAQRDTVDSGPYGIEGPMNQQRTQAQGDKSEGGNDKGNDKGGSGKGGGSGSDAGGDDKDAGNAPAPGMPGLKM